MNEAIAAKLVWVVGTYATTDHDDKDINYEYHLRCWRADGYTIVRQQTKDGLFILKTPDGKGQICTFDLSVAQAAAQADHEARVRAALDPAWLARVGQPSAETIRAEMREWAGKRQRISTAAWIRAARKALDGDMRELRNRVELHDAGPLEIVQSDAVLTPEADT